MSSCPSYQQKYQENSWVHISVVHYTELHVWAHLERFIMDSPIYLRGQFEKYLGSM